MAQAKLDLNDSNLMTPLMSAIVNNKPDIVKYLVQAGASLQAKVFFLIDQLLIGINSRIVYYCLLLSGLLSPDAG